MRKTLLFVLLLKFASYGSSFTQELILDTSSSYLAASPLQVVDSMHARLRAIATGKIDPLTSLNTDFWYIFRTQNANLVDSWNRIDQRFGSNPVIHIRYMNALARSKTTNAAEQLREASKSSNPIFREIAASGFAILGDTLQIPFCKNWLSTESNDYVISTLACTIRRLTEGKRGKSIPYLPLLYQNTPPTDSFLYNQNVHSIKSQQYVEADKVLEPDLNIAEGIIYPHQQYSWSLHNAPSKGSFANQHGPLFHTGMDTGWLLEGLPVHAIANGRVRFMQHDATWGTLVVVESAVNDSTFFTTLYGHLDPELDIRVGDDVDMGQKIGVIGRSFTLDNGGYIAHLHLTIEMSQYWNAHKLGYDRDIKRYTTVKELISQFGGGTK